MVHIAESTIGRRYAGWFIKNNERAQRILDDLKNAPLPLSPGATQAQGESKSVSGPQKGNTTTQGRGTKVR
jgi:translation initiation factor 3 subunit L